MRIHIFMNELKYKQGKFKQIQLYIVSIQGGNAMFIDKFQLLQLSKKHILPEINIINSLSWNGNIQFKSALRKYLNIHMPLFCS